MDLLVQFTYLTFIDSFVFCANNMPDYFLHLNERYPYIAVFNEYNSYTYSCLIVITRLQILF